ncbi:MAG TPA: hypothetical protein VHE35_12835 [Kofleriaceae bacterium]|nr:hypothetical protein [Kofleriaceae bacterium]
MRRLSIAAVLVAATACGGGKAAPREPAGNLAPAPPDAGVDAGPDFALLTGLADGFAETLATMAKITTDAPDCPTMAAQLGQLFDQAASLFAMAEAQAKDPAAARVLTQAMNARSGEVKPLVEKIGDGLARCQNDPAVGEVMARMPTF